MIYSIDKLISIISTLSPTFEASGHTCNELTNDDENCDNCYFRYGKHCGATFNNPDWQPSLDQLKFTNPEFFV